MIGTPLGIAMVDAFARFARTLATAGPERPFRAGTRDDGEMKVSTALHYAGDFRASAARARELESVGVDMIWIAEAYGFDAVSLCGYLAAVTERAELATGILPVYSRTPALLAQTAAGLDALS